MLRLCVFSLLILLVGSGCTRSYWANRGNDALDVVTVSVGGGIGTVAHVGPVNAGLGIYGDWFGMRNGEIGPLLGMSYEILTLGEDVNGMYHMMESMGKKEVSRHKKYGVVNVIIPIPMQGPLCGPIYEKGSFVPASYWTQIEIFAAAGVGFRVGLNPGELLDFLAGFTTLDIYGDDICQEGPVPETKPPTAAALRRSEVTEIHLLAAKEEPIQRP